MMSKWTPTTNLMMLRRMGKTGEEAAELLVVTNRCIIQGIDEIDPGTGKVNRARLQDELADVQAQIACTVLALGLDQDYMGRRTAEKIRKMHEWESMFIEEAAANQCFWFSAGRGGRMKLVYFWFGIYAVRLPHHKMAFLERCHG